MSDLRYVQIQPIRLRIEASSVCQLRCPSCPTTSGAIHPAVGSGLLRLEDFEKILAENPRIVDVELSNYGEILLNPELPEILRLAWRRGVALSAANGVNFNHAKPELLEDLVRYRFRNLSCSIDGASQETYSKYRVRGDLDTVLGNIREINRFKARHRSSLPALTWQFVVFGHNQHEIPLARKLAGELGMRFRLKLSWDPRLSPVVDPEALRSELGAATREEYRREHGADYMQGICHQLWDMPQVNWDGKMLGCCRNFWGDFGGNAFTDGLAASVNSQKMRHAREMLLGRAAPVEGIPCTTCEIYLGMKAEGKWLDRRGRSWRGRAWQRVRRLFEGLRDGLKRRNAGQRGWHGGSG